MATKQRKIEVHRLTISGLPEGTAYGQFLRNLRGRTRPVADMVMKAGEKSHALNEASLRNHRLKLRFLSYTKGHRPDVLDTSEFSVQPNPLTPAQTNVEWTHALGGLKNGRYILLIERNFNGPGRPRWSATFRPWWTDFTSRMIRKKEKATKSR
jgi:hypothetical protein